MSTSAPLQTPDRTRGCCKPLPPSIPDGQAEELAGVLRAMGDPTRLQMLHMLKASPEPICVCDFTAAFDLGQPTVSHHLGRLRKAGFVVAERRGVWAHYRLRPDMPAPARWALALVP